MNMVLFNATFHFKICLCVALCAVYNKSSTIHRVFDLVLVYVAQHRHCRFNVAGQHQTTWLFLLIFSSSYVERS